MTRLYPRLLPNEVGAAFERLQKCEPKEIEQRGLVDVPFVFAAAGGDRVSGDEVRRLRSDLTDCATEFGYPDARSVEELIAFDRTLARWLHAELDIAPGEASSRSVWAYIGLVVAPHVVAWRFPARDGNYTRERFDGGDLTRNAFSRLWWRAELLRDEAEVDPHALLDVLGEEAMDQLMARRRSLAASPALARAIVRVARDRGGVEREVFRDALQRLLRLAAFIDFDASDPLDVIATVQQEFETSYGLLAGGRPTGV